MALGAILTADIVNSTMLKPEAEKQLIGNLGEILSPYKYEFYRGDSFQVYLKESKKALETALLCRTAAIRFTGEKNDVTSDVRISIGIGKVETPIKNLGAAKGEAFLLSGRALDEMDKSAGRLVITTNQPMANLAFEVMAAYINSIYKEMTPKQAEVIFELLQGSTQQEVAGKLNRSKSTIHQHVTAGKWEEIASLLMKYKKMIDLMEA